MRTSSPVEARGALVDFSHDDEETVMGLAVNLNHPAHYLHWGVIQLSVGNLIVIVVMLVLFFAAILLPFPKGRNRR